MQDGIYAQLYVNAGVGIPNSQFSIATLHKHVWGSVTSVTFPSANQVVVIASDVNTPPYCGKVTITLTKTSARQGTISYTLATPPPSLHASYGPTTYWGQIVLR